MSVYDRPYGRLAARRHVLGARLRNVLAWAVLWSCALVSLARAHAFSIIRDVLACFGFIFLVILTLLLVWGR